MTKKALSAPRCAALVGPYLSGKTSLMEALLFHAGAIPRKGSVKEANTVGDAAPESRARAMSTETTIATCTYLDEDWTFLDCPGSIELLQWSENATMVCDVAVVVCEAAPEKALTVAPILQFLDDHDIPHMVFINKMDHATPGVRAMLDALQDASARPLVLREIPLRSDDGTDTITGHVDLVSERAFVWEDHKPSNLVSLPDDLLGRERRERDDLLETLADFDDHLLEELLNDVAPSADEIYDTLRRDLQSDLVVPVFFGSAEHDHGVRRLFKALRHDAPGPLETARRLGVSAVTDGTAARVFQVRHAGQAGKLSVVRVLGGVVPDGSDMGGERVSGVFRLFGDKFDKTTKAGLGQVAALGRLDKARTGDLLTEAEALSVNWPDPLPALYTLALHPSHSDDEVKLTGVLDKLAEEDPSLRIDLCRETGELLIRGQGDVHLAIARDRLKHRYGLSVDAALPDVAYKETIRRDASPHARHKKQSGGHGEFGDVHLVIRPLPRGSGLTFDEKIAGGVVPRQYIPAVESGVKGALAKGPLGYPVVDVAVTLIDGQHHSVDSSEMAFRKAASAAMRDGLAAASPVLLEPIHYVEVSAPSPFTSNLQRLISGRRGHIMGFQPMEMRRGWDTVSAHLPEAELRDLVIELRSVTQGVGTFAARFDHLAELTGKAADAVIGK